MGKDATYNTELSGAQIKALLTSINFPSLAEKLTRHDDDHLQVWDSEDANKAKKIKVSNLVPMVPMVPNKNLLINGDFRNPVNQRGQSSYTNASVTAVVGIDGWKLYGVSGGSSASLTINDGYITLSTAGGTAPGYMAQFTEYPLKEDTTLTFSVGVITGNCTIMIRSTDWYIYAQKTVSTGIDSITATVPAGKTVIVQILPSNINSSVDIWGAKLERGSVSTLASDPPADFGEELRKCQRYLFNAIDTPASGVGAALGTGVALSATGIRILLPIPAHMRPIAATVILSSPSHFQCVGASTLNISALEHGTTSTNAVMLIATVTGATPGQSYYLRRATGATDGRLLISKEL